MKKQSGWYQKPNSKVFSYWDGQKWLKVPYPDSTNTFGLNQKYSNFAIASFICAFLFFPLAIIFGHIALNEISKSKEPLQGQGLAIAGLVIGYLWLFFILIIFLVTFASDSFINDPSIWSV